MAITSNGKLDADAGLELLRALQGAISGGTPMTEGEGVQFYDGTVVRVPTGMSYQGVRAVIDRAEQEAETETTWTRVYKFRPDDGAYATAQVLKRRFGGAFGEATWSMFGKNPPELRTITLNAKGLTAQVPWGKVSLPSLDKTSLYIGETGDREYGRIFGLSVNGPRKYKDEVGAFLDEVERYLADHSIYRGKAIVGANSPEFIDLSGFRAEEIVFSTKATALLNNTLWLPLKHADALRAEGIPLKRAVLLHGPYGTGKTSAGIVTAQLAVEKGWTTVFARAGKDNIEDTLRTARLYQPAMVVIEDIDNETSNGDTERVSRLLEALDGATAKGQEIMMVVTTNRLHQIHKGMLRPGRFDAVIEIAALDKRGIEGLIRAVVDPAKLNQNTDFDVVSHHMQGFFPAFVREAVDRARVLGITRAGRNYRLDTAALTDAADTLAAQLDAMNAATEGTPKPTLDRAFRDATRGALEKFGWVRSSEDPVPDAYLMDPEKVPVNTE